MAEVALCGNSRPLICIKPAEETALSLSVELQIVPWEGCVWSISPRETNMKLSIALSALLIAGFVAATTEPAGAVVYCQYVEYPAGCTVRAGVVLRPRPVARAVATPGVGRVGTPTNRGGPVDRVGRR
jgi:hypothetical protein